MPTVRAILWLVGILLTYSVVCQIICLLANSEPGDNGYFDVVRAYWTVYFSHPTEATNLQRLLDMGGVELTVFSHSDYNVLKDGVRKGLWAVACWAIGRCAGVVPPPAVEA